MTITSFNLGRGAPLARMTAAPFVYLKKPKQQTVMTGARICPAHQEARDRRVSIFETTAGRKKINGYQMKIPCEILDRLGEEGSFAVLVLLCATNPATLRFVVSMPSIELAEFIAKNTAGADEPIGLLLYATDDDLPFIVVLGEAADKYSEEKVKNWLWGLANLAAAHSYGIN